MNNIQIISFVGIAGVIVYYMQRYKSYKGNISRVKHINRHIPNHEVPHHMHKRKRMKQKHYKPLVKTNHFVGF